jgi:N-methylhydantoinase B
LKPVRLTIVSERRKLAPYGLMGGLPGSRGKNILIRGDQSSRLPGNVSADVSPGDCIRIETPGGGGWGSPPKRL